MFFEIMDEKRTACLRTLTAIPEIKDFYLAGGTALSLQLGLRESFDFDFFSQRRFNADAVCAAIRERFERVHVNHMDADTCDLLADDIRVSLMRYPYPLVAAPVRGQGDWEALSLAGIEDIAVMKLSAIGGRGARKDFYDLYQIYQRCPSFDSERLLLNARQKFGEQANLNYMLMGLTFFDDAEAEALPRLFVDADWEAIKRFFVREQQRLFAIDEARFRSGSDK
ncbi:MAG: nucleotidyl transferase AbiEii/AbiGii toxin family protein [Clostridia bacterium]|nr:nucleotidyl transferase AbiEii/AbiGii toxin family protein [Clostridia bacterium]